MSHSNTQPSLRDMIAELIAQPSVSCSDPALDMSNRAVAETLATWLDDFGMDCELMPISTSSDKVNLIARLGAAASAASDNGLVLAGHLDTVPYDATGWESDPFTLSERNGNYYGLGTTDMKGFLAIAADVAREYSTAQFKAPLTILASADEECGMDGARALADSGRQLGRHALIGEPTNLVPIHRHKGIFMEAIRVMGKAGHSSNPAHGTNAIEGMREVMNTLANFRQELSQQISEDDFPVRHATLNLGVLRGGDSPNRIPAHCELQVDLRFLPGMDIDALRSELRQRASSVLANTDYRVEYDELFVGTPAMDTKPDAEIVRMAEKISGQSSQSVDFGTEGAFYNRMGMDTVILGPGDIALAHQPNEYLAIERIEPMRVILRSLIEHFCIA